MARKADHADTPGRGGGLQLAGDVGPGVCLCGHGPGLHGADCVIYGPCVACACQVWRPWQKHDAQVIRRAHAWWAASRQAGGGNDAA